MCRWLLVVACAACGVRAPAPVDVGALVAKRGAVEAHRDLAILVLHDPRDVQAHLALADLDDRIGRPGEALDQLAEVDQLSGPLGTRWHAADRARFGNLLGARGLVRLARGAASALGDLERAHELGGHVEPGSIDDARLQLAITLLRHVDADVRAKGRKLLSGTPRQPWMQFPCSCDPVRDARGRLGAWLWSVGARREAYEQLARWHGEVHVYPETLLAAYEQALAWWSPGSAIAAEDAITAPPPVHDLGEPGVTAPARYAHAIVSDIEQAPLERVARAHRRDPAIGERLARDLVASSIDTASAHAALGALYDALGDPGRARTEWQAAVDGSPEPAFIRGLADAAARGGDGPAAVVFATKAAAAWGDPATVWVSVARALESRQLHVDALQAARSALELAGPDTRGGALDVAIAASRELGRTAQADALAAQRGALAEPAEVAAALAAYQRRPTAASVAQLWVASRARPGQLALLAALYAATTPDDPRHDQVGAELGALVMSPDRERALAAVHALSQGP
jgi:hypothetical protein